MEKVWIDYADDYICLVTGFKLCYEIILVRDSDDNTHKEWFHGVLYLDEYTEEELKKAMEACGFTKEDVDADAYFTTAALCLAETQTRRLVSTDWAYARIQALTGFSYGI